MDDDGPSWGYFPGTLVGNGSCMPNSTSEPGTRHYVYAVYSHKLWYGMLLVGLVMLSLYALLSGVILAVCGPEMAWLQLRSITGTPDERKRARIVSRMRRHSSWMLCSLILCTVACAESLPIIIQGLWAEPTHSQWIPILVSTLVIALCAEILPQYFIPRNPVEWAYFFWPVIYSCMCLTAVISWPLGWILDNFGGKNDGNGIFTNGELVSLIKYHERSEKNGGMLGHDAARAMTGALLLDSRQIGGEIYSMPEIDCPHEKDVEKANMVVSNGLITRWSSVKSVDIDEAVDSVFLSKVKSWSYSRIPVTGTCILNPQSIGHSSWQGREIFGFLHLNSLVGLEITASHKMFVRDLPIYPLPIVQEDMPAYLVLNIFQLGMARMAIVVPKPLKNGHVLTLSANNFDIVNKFQTPCWAPIEKNTTRVVNGTDKSNSDEAAKWVTGVLEAANTRVEKSINVGQENAPRLRQEHNENKSGRNHQPSHNVVGIRCPKPVGIVTFEDIVAVLLQKPSRISIDFFNGGTMNQPVQPRPIVNRYGAATTGATRTAVPAFSNLHNVEAIPLYVRSNSVRKQHVNSNLRKRNISGRGTLVRAMDGADDASFELMSLETQAAKRCTSGRSSYTQNSQGGFHGSASSVVAQLPTRGLDGADECIFDRMYGQRHVASDSNQIGPGQIQYQHKVDDAFHNSLTSEDTIHNAMDLTQQLLAELGGSKYNNTFTDEMPRSCSLPLWTALALSRSSGSTAPWARRYFSVAAPMIGRFPRESHSSLGRIAAEQPLTYKLNPAAPVFKITSPTDHDYLADQDTNYSSAALSLTRVDGRNLSSSAPSISSSFNTRASWLYNASKVTLEPRSVEDSEMLDWNPFKHFDNSTAPEPYNGDPNSLLFDGPTHTPSPSEGIPTELLNNLARRTNRLVNHKSETLPSIRGGGAVEGSCGRDWNLDNGTNEKMLLEGENKARVNKKLITIPKSGIRRFSLWF